MKLSTSRSSIHGSGPRGWAAFLLMLSTVAGCSVFNRDVDDVELQADPDAESPRDTVDTGGEDDIAELDATEPSDATDTTGGDVADVEARDTDTGDVEQPPIDADDTGDDAEDATDETDAEPDDATDTAPDPDGSVDAPDLPAPAEGELVITEFMADPEAQPDDTGEWFELYNPSDSQAYLLDGCVIRDKDSDSLTLDAPTFVVEPQTYVTLAQSSSPGYGEPDHAYDQKRWTLANSGDEIILSCNDVTVDAVDYDSGSNWSSNQPTEGQSKGLDPSKLSATENDDGANWCDQTSEVDGYGDQATPGSENDSCGLP